MCSESLVRHLLTSWIHKYLESGLLSPLGPGSKIGPKCSEIGRCQPRLRGMNPPRWDPPPAHRPPWALSCTLCISVISAQGAFQTCASCKKKRNMVTYVILPAWLAQKVGSLFFLRHCVSVHITLFVCFLSYCNVQMYPDTWNTRLLIYPLDGLGGFVQVGVTCRFSDQVHHFLPANWPPISGSIKQAKLKVTE